MKSVMIHANKKGFTILELLVSMAIIAILAAVTLATITGIKQKSRDGKRLSDMREITKALNLYSNNHGRYPTAPSEIAITSDDAFSLELEGDLVITNVPRDPLYPSTEYKYTYLSADGNTFTLSFCLETNTIRNFSQGCGNTMKP